MVIVYGVSEATKEFLKKLPKDIHSIDQIDDVLMQKKQELEAIEDKGIGNKFNRWRKQRVINKIEDNIDNVEHAGAKGEQIALWKFNQLPDNFHVFCGVNKELKNYIRYKGRRDLKSAQMDFIVLSKRGVNVVEVKNWSYKFYKSNNGISPHEQVDRAGKVLWLTLKSSWFAPKNPSVSAVILSINNTIPYDENFGYVTVKNLENINNYFTSKNEIFTDKEVSRLIGRIKGDITK